jgi:MOSC domain-containing protein YiiM
MTLSKPPKSRDFAILGRLVSLQVGMPQHLGNADATDQDDQPWYSGFIKLPVDRPLMARRTNLDGDGQADLKVHGGPDKAILAYSADHYPSWQTVLQREFPYGAFGENLSIAGASEADYCIGDVLELGQARLQVSQPRQPCWKLARRWGVDQLSAAVIKSGRSGWYLRVLAEGMVETGQSLRLLERPCPEFPVAWVNQLRYRQRTDQAAVERLATCELLSQTWRAHFADRLRK